MNVAAREGALIASKYRLEQLIGQGGMGAVYRAVHVGVGKRCALKLMSEAPSKDTAQRFTREARAAAKIGHPNIVDVFDIGTTDDGSLFLVMELLEGHSLNETLDAGPLPVDQALRICVEVLRALDAAHRAGIVHRDIKPANIFLARQADGREHVKLLDFGIAKDSEADAGVATQSGAVVGTPRYMAPEQLLAQKDIDGRADVWALGASLFEMLTGRRAHAASTPTAEAIHAITQPAPRVTLLRPDVDERVADVVARALLARREERWATAAEMLAALEPLVSEGMPASTSSGVSSASGARALSSPVLRSTWRKQALLAITALLGGVVVAFAVVRLTRPPAPTAASGVASPASAVPSAVSTAEAPTPTPSSSEPLSPEALSREALSRETVPSPSSAAPIARETPLVAVPAAAPARSRSAIAAASASTSAPVRPEVSAAPSTCGPGEARSGGHCCLIGLVWTGDRCDRPLATTPPY